MHFPGPCPAHLTAFTQSEHWKSQLAGRRAEGRADGTYCIDGFSFGEESFFSFNTRGNQAVVSDEEIKGGATSDRKGYITEKK